VESRTNQREVRPEFATRTIEPVIDGMASLGVRYEVVRKLPGGAWGAWLVRGGDGRVAVLKCLWDADWRDRIASASRVVDVLASRGAPVPRYLVSGYTPELGTWYAQEYLSGQRIEQLSASLLADVFSLNDMQAGCGRVAQGTLQLVGASAKRHRTRCSPVARAASFRVTSSGSACE
jgi:hypothetical protein